jgi:chromosome segregation ATPase
VSVLDNFLFYTFFRISNRSLEEQLAIASSNVQRLTTEVEVLRHTKYNTERMALTLESVQATLQRVDAEKTQNLQSQLESITLERDNLKNLCENLKEQSEHFTNELRVN